MKIRTLVFILLGNAALTGGSIAAYSYATTAYARMQSEVAADAQNKVVAQVRSFMESGRPIKFDAPPEECACSCVSTAK